MHDCGDFLTSDVDLASSSDITNNLYLGRIKVRNERPEVEIVKNAASKLPVRCAWASGELISAAITMRNGACLFMTTVRSLNS